MILSMESLMQQLVCYTENFLLVCFILRSHFEVMLISKYEMS